MHHPIVALIDMVLGLYGWTVFIYVMLQLLVYFQIINPSQTLISKVTRFLADIIEPALNKIRKHVKPYNNIDLSPAILLIAIYFVQYCINYYF